MVEPLDGRSRPAAAGPGEDPRSAAAPFALRTDATDRALALASRIERAVRALGRMASGRPGAAGVGELARVFARQRPAGGPVPAGAPIVVLAAVAWSYRFQRPQALSRALADAGVPVLYVEVFRRTRLLPRVELNSPVAGVWRLQLAARGRPDPYREPAPPGAGEELARRVVAGLRQRPRMVLAQLPFWAPLAMTLREACGAPLVYDCIDLHAGFGGVPASLAALEERLLAECDLVTATSPPLLAGARGARRAALLPNAVDLAAFPETQRELGGAVTIGYVGALAEWFDAEAVEGLAASRPDWRLRLAGRVEDERVRALGRLPNVELLGEIPHASVPAFLSGLQALVIPFRDGPLTRAVDPVKLYEALACGLPVVGRRLPALERWPEPFVYGGADGALLAPLERALAEDAPALARLRRRAVAGETWAVRAETLLALATGLVAEAGRAAAQAGD